MYIEKYNIPISDGNEDKLALYVSPGEYPIYESEQYEFMEEDKLCEKAYLKAIKKVVKGKNVLDIGTGENMDWAMYALDYYAHKSTGIEVLPRTFNKAQENLKVHFYEKYLTLINILSTDFKPEEKFDVIISEIIGTIGGSEGAGLYLKDARDRLLKEGGVMIPYSCSTMIGGICIREMMPRLEFLPLTLNYIEKIFAFNGGEFDLRLTFTFNTPEALITTKGEAEVLEFFKPNFPIFNLSKEIDLIVTKDGLFDGLALWINLLAEKDGILIDSLEEETAWEVVYFPIFDEPVKVSKGEIIKVWFSSFLSDDVIHPNYAVLVKIRDQMESFTSLFKGQNWQSKKIYKELFPKK